MASLPALRQSCREEEIGREVLKGPKGWIASGTFDTGTPSRISMHRTSTAQPVRDLRSRPRVERGRVPGVTRRVDTPYTYSQGDNCHCSTPVAVHLANLVVTRPLN
jgi:hypothetical protein